MGWGRGGVCGGKVTDSACFEGVAGLGWWGGGVGREGSSCLVRRLCCGRSRGQRWRGTVRPHMSRRGRWCCQCRRLPPLSPRHPPRKPPPVRPSALARESAALIAARVSQPCSPSRPSSRSAPRPPCPPPPPPPPAPLICGLPLICTCQHHVQGARLYLQFVSPRILDQYLFQEYEHLYILKSKL